MRERLAREIARSIGEYGSAGVAIAKLTLLVLNVLCYCMIFKKAGYSGCLGCAVFLPIVGQVLLIWFAFANWPAIGRKRSRG